MTSPLIRTWLAQNLPDWCDHAYACWRGLLTQFGGQEWDPCQINPYYTLLPGLADTEGKPAPALHLVLPCRTCKAHSNAPCMNRYGETTGPHKSRREAAANATAVTS